MVIADDQALVRGGFRLILKAAGIDVVAEAADGAQAVAAARAHRPDVVLMDIRMPVMDGIEATRQILADAPPDGQEDGGPPTRIIILTTFDLDAYVYAALAAGASGFLLKDVTPEHLVAAVQLVRTGDALLAPSITRRLVERFAGTGTARLAGRTPARETWTTPGEPAACSPVPDDCQGPRPWRALGGRRETRRSGPAACDTSALTRRELEVLGLVARGMSNAEIAASLTLAEATVKTHVARILTKLSLRNRVQAVVLAYETGLISPAAPRRLTPAPSQPRRPPGRPRSSRRTGPGASATAATSNTASSWNSTEGSSTRLSSVTRTRPATTPPSPPPTRRCGTAGPTWTALPARPPARYTARCVSAAIQVPSGLAPRLAGRLPPRDRRTAR